MKKLSKFAAGCLSAAMFLSLSACSGGQAAPPSGGGDAPSQAPSEDASYTVGICQLAPHPALDAATEGFKAALTDAFGDRVTIDEKNAAGDSPTCATIVNGFVSADVDLILANATSALQAAASATGDIPVLGTAVTEYGVALGIDNFGGTVGTNVSGTSDLAPLDQQAAMIQEWCPEAKTVGLIYCSAEANSQYQVDTVQASLQALGYTCTQYPFTDTNDMASIVQNAADNNDVIYVPTDNTVATNAGIVDNICRGKVPVFAGEEGICAGCGVATLSISYYDLGYTTGQMAVKILTGEANVAEMPIEYAPQFTKKYNEATCTALGLTPPDGYEAIVVE
ncbi:ABC transporter substrate-binding protein [Pseudoflavonifractor sp. 524-17]|uniref:ABC transporter substrate-binding protein n=1 Tax=Pseudoflavonifractor sp. 524-17 TaxID=2304577 RepID=UPI001379E63D|nr:ABC transporter substrate-binding protein [Pseudoflavonifractor sp. 524-17]NCE64768.1 ABC transporter substrate-binding protein [Pseudoflavonifractor sp. 524-17]